MSKINSTALNPGMVLAEDICLPDGRLLMKKGTILDFEHLRSVRVGGVKEVEILDTLDPVPGSGTAPSAVPDIHHTGAKAPWEKRFSKCDPDHPVIQELYRLAALNLAYSEASLQKDWSSPDLEAGLPSLFAVCGTLSQIQNLSRRSAIHDWIGSGTGLPAGDFLPD